MSDFPHDQPPIESDPVWNLLERSQSRQAGSRFADDVVRMARLDGDRPMPFWHRWFAPLPATAFAGVAAALVVGFFALRSAPDASPVDAPVAIVADPASDAGFAHIQEVLETEMLFAAIDHLDDFSDEELIVLIGF